MDEMNTGVLTSQSTEEARQGKRRCLEDFESDGKDEELQSSQRKRRRLRGVYMPSPLSPACIESASRINTAGQMSSKDRNRNVSRSRRVPPLYVFAILNRTYSKAKRTSRLRWCNDDNFERYIDDISMKVCLLSSWYRELHCRPNESGIATTAANLDDIFPVPDNVSWPPSPSMLSPSGIVQRNSLPQTSEQPLSVPSENMNANRYEIFDNEDGYFDSDSASDSDNDKQCEGEAEDREDDKNPRAQPKNSRRSKALVYSDFNRIQL